MFEEPGCPDLIHGLCCVTLSDGVRHAYLDREDGCLQYDSTHVRSPWIESRNDIFKHMLADTILLLQSPIRCSSEPALAGSLPGAREYVRAVGLRAPVSYYGVAVSARIIIKLLLGYTVADISWKGEGPAVFCLSGYVVGSLPVSSRCCKIRPVSRSVAGRHLSPFDVV